MTKKARNQKPHIRNAKFANRNFSPLESHPRSARTLKSPFSRVPGLIHKSVWHSECIPNILWACLLISNLEREHCLQLFRNVLIDLREEVEGRKELFVTHNFLSVATPDEFDATFRRVLSDPRAKDVLSALLLTETLPDLDHWKRHLVTPESDRHSTYLLKAVGRTFDHQSQESTDVRWLKVMSLMICQERLVFGPQFGEMIEEFRLYPDKGEMAKVRPMIRSLEMSCRPIELGEEAMLVEGGRKLPPLHLESFWAEMKRKTGCIGGEKEPPPVASTEQLTAECAEIIQEVTDHFHQNDANTAPDPRLDASFGLVLYALQLLLKVSLGRGHFLPEGRLVLRTVLEAGITLRYLSLKDDTAVWLQYRSYGTGQAKLAFLKNVRFEEAPDFVDLETLEFLANEDMWMEFQDIEIGNWAESNLRKLAETVEMKDVYDKIYDWASGYAHSQWASVRDATMTTCLNPLHRYHRIPKPGFVTAPSTLKDTARLVNRMLDELNKLYPSFKPRLKWHNAPASAE